MFYIIVILAGIFAMPAKADGLKDQLVGTWALVSCERVNGAVPSYCAGANGIAIRDANGHYALIIAALNRPKYDGKEPYRDTLSAEQIKSVTAGFVSNFGTWSVDEATKKITHHVDGALFPNVAGTSYDVTVRGISGDELKLGGPLGAETWRRISK
jgi:hypothetical protein